MTWFLSEKTSSPTSDIEPLAGVTPSWGEQSAAATIDYWKRRDTWNSADQYRNELTNEILVALAPDGRLMIPAKDMTEFQTPETRGYYLARRVAELRSFGTDNAFSNFPTTPEEFDAEVLRRRQRDFDANRKILDLGDSPTAKFSGEMVGGILDPINIATAPIGGGGGVVRYISTQAAVGAATELPGVLTEQSVAKDLKFKPEDPTMAVATAAVGSAALAGTIKGAGRAVDYFRGTRQAANAMRPAHVSGIDYEDAIDDAHEALRLGRDPVDLPGQPVIGDGYYAAIRSAESSGNDAAKNPLSSATGRYQFIDSTWQDVRRKHPELGLTRDGRLDPRQQERAIRAFTEDNADQLQAAGIEINNGNLYAAHFLGAPGAKRVLSSPPQAMLTDILGPDVIRANPHLRKMSVADFNDWTAEKTRSSPGTLTGGADTGPGLTDPAWNGPMRGPNYFDQIYTPAGTSVNVSYRVLDLSDLKAASGDLQPRDRTRLSSDEQIAYIAANLDPRRLMPSIEGDRGAPIIGDDLIIESGNGRVAALRRAAIEHPERYAAYVNEIRNAGFDIPDNVHQPVLVAERRTPLDSAGRRNFVRENNTSGIARMSASEQAATNADYLTDHAFDAYRPGEKLASPANGEFLRRMFSAMPQAERAPFRTRDGELTVAGLSMVKQALFSRAFPADDLLRQLAEGDSPALSSLMRMMEDLAPDWASFRSAVDAGYLRREFDITDQLVDIIRQIAHVRVQGRDGQSVIAALRDRLSTSDMFASRDDKMTGALLDAFFKGERARTAEATQSILQRYIADATQVGRADIGDLLGDGPDPAQVMRHAVEAHDARVPMPEILSRNSVADVGPAGPLNDMTRLDGGASTDGAISTKMIRSTDAALREIADASEMGPFGPVWRQIDNDPEAAIAHLLSVKTGEVPVAYRHPDSRVGELALIYGNEGMGLRHIQAKHPEMIGELPRILREGKVVEDAHGLSRLYLVDDHAPAGVVVIRLDWDGQGKHWIVTSFNDEQGQVARQARTSNEPPASVSSRIPDTTGRMENSNSKPDTQPARDRDAIDIAIADARAQFADSDDVEIRLGEGPNAPVVTVREALADIDSNRSLIERATSCSLKGVPK